MLSCRNLVSGQGDGLIDKDSMDAWPPEHSSHLAEEGAKGPCSVLWPPHLHMCIHVHIHTSCTQKYNNSRYDFRNPNLNIKLDGTYLKFQHSRSFRSRISTSRSFSATYWIPSQPRLYDTKIKSVTEYYSNVSHFQANGTLGICPKLTSACHFPYIMMWSALYF